MAENFKLRKSKFLERTWNVRILLALLDMDHAPGKMELVNRISRGTTNILGRIDDLRDLGLIKETKEADRRKIVELTPRGRAIAEHLREIESLMSKR